ncbi:hypothetical protein ACFL7M_09925 [Thermodesulfobacteriota bacterium]
MIEKKYYESDFENLELSKCNKSHVNSFLKIVNSKTLGRKVAIAVNLKKQGHFNKAVLYITEANRDQVLAIREIQTVLDKLEGREKTEVLLEKFRQIFPLQLGLTNGEEVLDLLMQIKAVYEGRFSEIISELHHNEEELDMLLEELSFFQERMKEKISEKELDDIKEKVSQATGIISSTKNMIINNLIKFFNERFNSITIDDRLCLIKNCYIIITSSIETLDAKLVEVQNH